MGLLLPDLLTGQTRAGIVAHKKNLAVQCRWHHQEKVNHTPETHIPSPNLSSPSCRCCCDQFPFGGPCRGHNVLSAMAATIVRNSASPKVNPKSLATHTTATAATIMRNFHDGPKVVQVSCNTHNGNGRNDYAEFSHDGRSHATHYGNGRNDCAEFSHDGPTKTRATHTTATATTIMWNFHTKATKLAQHTTATAPTIVQNLHTVKLAQHTQQQ